jgi:hypothetical protein
MGPVGRPERGRAASAVDARLEELVAGAGAALWRARSLAEAAPPRTADHVLLRAALRRAAAALAEAERHAGRVAAPVAVIPDPAPPGPDHAPVRRL